MGVLSLFCFAISIFRFVYTDTKVFLFLNWNLFLAFVPWAVSSLIMLRPKLRQSKWMLALLLCTWLLFFPNAPYILTDLFHLHISSSMPVWFDLVLILSFAWTGLLFGFLSLWDIEDLMRNWLKEKYVVLVSVLLLFIGSFGIYPHLAVPTPLRYRRPFGQSLLPSPHLGCHHLDGAVPQHFVLFVQDDSKETLP